MARALGIGGAFFKSPDPKALAAWYSSWLGVPVDEQTQSVAFQPDQLPQGAFSVWGPFDAATEYFAPSAKPFMVNLIVDDLDGALSQVAEGGAEIVGEIEEYDFGRFGWFVDPDGNKVELWEPAPASS